MKTLPISSTLSLPLDAVTQKLAFLGRTGTGKSYAAMRLCELMMDAGAQVIALDPVGVWFGLRLAGDGRRPSRFTLPVFGGDHGDLPLTRQSGKIIAKLIIERRLSAVLDVSMLRKGERKQFATDFAEEMFELKKSARSPVHVFIEESQAFVPQKTFKGEERMLGAFEDLIKLGRNYGIGASLISQRPQAVNKEALNQTECLFAFQMTGPQERKAIEAWVSEKGMPKTIAGDLPRLSTGYPHVWSPQWLDISKVIDISSKTTFDASSTPDFSRSFAVSDLAPIDVEALKAELAGVITQAEADDPAALRRRIVELERALRQPKATAVSEDVVKVAVANEAQRWQRILEDVQQKYREHIREVNQRLEKARELATRISAIPDVRFEPPPVPDVRVASPPPVVKPESKAKPTVIQLTWPKREPSENSMILLVEGERRMLQILGQFAHLGALTRDQLALLSGYTRSGTFDKYVGNLARHGLIEKLAGGRLQIAGTGRTMIGDDALTPPQTSAELIAAFGAKLCAGERKMLDVLVVAYPKAVTRDELARQTGYTRSGTFDKYVGRLRRNLLIVKEAAGHLRASDDLFLGER